MVYNYSVWSSFNKKFHEQFYIAITRGMVETGLLQKEKSRNSPDGANGIRFGGSNVWMYPNNGFGDLEWVNALSLLLLLLLGARWRLIPGSTMVFGVKASC
jgi:hypothetical protein